MLLPIREFLFNLNIYLHRRYVTLKVEYTEHSDLIRHYLIYFILAHREMFFNLFLLTKLSVYRFVYSGSVFFLNEFMFPSKKKSGLDAVKSEN